MGLDGVGHRPGVSQRSAYTPGGMRCGTRWGGPSPGVSQRSVYTPGGMG